jgi:hypothetical protein
MPEAERAMPVIRDFIQHGLNDIVRRVPVGNLIRLVR